MEVAPFQSVPNGTPVGASVSEEQSFTTANSYTIRKKSVVAGQPSDPLPELAEEETLTVTHWSRCESALGVVCAGALIQSMEIYLKRSNKL